MNQEIILKAENLVKAYTIRNRPATPVLKGISVDIKKGEFLSLMGPSGVGKSTLLHLLASFDEPDEGQIELFVNDTKYIYNKLPSDELSRVRNKYLGFVFQFHHLLPEFTALENIMMPALISGESFATAKEKAKELSDKVGTSHRDNHKPSELSGGEQQRVAIARALINKPQIVFADEPTGNLDSQTALSILELIQNLRKEYSLTFVVATHSEHVAEIAQRKLIMADGRFVI